MTEAAKQSGIALEKAYQFMLWLMPTVEKFPRSQKFLLGDRMQGAALDILEGLVEATYSRNRSPGAARGQPQAGAAQISVPPRHRLESFSICAGFGAGGLPVAIQLAGKTFPAPTLFRLAHPFKKATPFPSQRPALVSTRAAA